MAIKIIRDGEPSFSEHIIIGRLHTMKPGRQFPGHYVVQFNVSVSHISRKTLRRHVTFYECSVYDYQAKIFEKMKFQMGDHIMLRLENLKVEAWTDSAGRAKASLKAFVGKFADLRPIDTDDSEPEPQAGPDRPSEGQSREPSKGPSAAAPSPAASGAQPSPGGGHSPAPSGALEAAPSPAPSGAQRPAAGGAPRTPSPSILRNGGGQGPVAAPVTAVSPSLAPRGAQGQPSPAAQPAAAAQPTAAGAKEPGQASLEAASKAQNGVDYDRLPWDEPFEENGEPEPYKPSGPRP
jgi:hypothetical protein